MTTSFLLAPIPKWVLINNEGTVAGGARLYTYRSRNKKQEKKVFQDSGGTLAWTNPIIFDLNGVQGPFYWVVNSADLSDTYYLEAYEPPADGSPEEHGPLLWTLDNYFPPGSGGGGNVQTYIPLTNYIANNQFIDHIDDTVNPVGVTNLVIAPSNHKGFTPALINPISSTYGVIGPDIRFIKNNTAATDQITFPLFVLGNEPLNGDVTPVDYVRYQCTNSPLGETFKCFQFPITQKVKNLSNQSMTFKIWARVTSSPVNLTVYVLQYFGSGTAASVEVRTPVGVINLDANWNQTNISLVIPDVAGKSLGTGGQQTDDDALYIQLEMPLGMPCDVLFTKPKLYLGTIDPSLEFEDYDQINSINSTPRTGDIKTSLLSSAPQGWIAMDDKSIGNIGSGATNRANKDTFQLYKTIWDGVIDMWAPVSTGRGASAVEDFVAGKTLTLPLSLGRAMAGSGAGSGLTPRVLGQNTGTETHILLAEELPPHTHEYLAHNSNNVAQAGGASGFTANTNQQTGNGPGTSTPFSIMQPTSFMNVFIKL